MLSCTVSIEFIEPNNQFDHKKNSIEIINFTTDNEKIIELLLKNGANCSIADEELRTPLHLLAATNGQLVLKLLLY